MIYGCQNKSAITQEVKTKSLTIAFGSCNKPEKDDSMWKAIGQNDPDLFIWLGDIIYGDTDDMEVLRGKYRKLEELPAYREFAANTPITGVWDDHDYGQNDAGKNYSHKEQSEEILLDFLKVDSTTEVRRHPGVYSSMTLGKAEQQVKVILLDGRYFRDSLVHSTAAGRRYEANPEGDMLGEQQWAWLEKELTDSQADVHIIGCGIQFIPEEHGWEKWANFPKARQRFFDLLSKTKVANPILISGDRHIAEVSKIALEGYQEPVYELTASGLTHTWSSVKEEANRYRVGQLIVQRNFGLINIEWSDGKNPDISLEVRGLGNELFQKNDL